MGWSSLQPASFINTSALVLSPTSQRCCPISLTTCTPRWPTSALRLQQYQWSSLTSWSALDSSVLFCIFLRKFGSTPELAGENSPSVSLSSSDCPPLLPGEELLEGELRWPGWIFIAFLFRRSPEGLLGLLPASSWIIIPETEGKSSEFRTRLRGGDDIY